MNKKLLLTIVLAVLTSLPTFAGSSTYYGKLTAKTNSSAQGLVYASTSNTAPTDDSSYTNSITTDPTSKSSSDDNVSLTFYAFAKAARGYEFSSWTAGTNATVGDNPTGSGDAITVTASGSETSPTTGTVTANFTALTGYTISYQTPEYGTYTVTYTYTAVQNNAFTEATTEYSLLPTSDTQTVTSYTDDVVTLSTERDNFVGWYTVDSDGNETELSTKNPYTYTVSADATIKAKFSATSSGSAASVTSGDTTIEYTTLADAIAAANELDTNPTVTLLSDIYDVDATQTISKSMTIDLNGCMVVSTATYTSASAYFLSLLDINGSGITVTITDNSTGGNGQMLFSGTLNKSITGVQVTSGTLNISGGKVYAQNKAAYSSNSSSKTYGVQVAAGMTLNVSGGEIEATGSRNVYGIYANNTSTATTTVNVTDGTVTATASYSTGYAYGIYSYGNVSLSDGTINANSSTGTYAYGIYMGANTDTDVSLTMTGGTINATTKTTNAYGIWAVDGTTITGGTISATATQNAYGVYAAAEINSSTGVASEGVVNISGGTISATTTTTTGAYGVYVQATSSTISSSYYAAAGAATISGGTISAAANTTTAYSVYAAATSTNGTASATPTCDITGGKFAASGTSTYANINSTAVADSVVIKGGYYTDVTNLSNYFASSDYTAFELESSTTEYTEGYRYYVMSYQDAYENGVYVALNTSTSTYYTKLEDALSAASSGNTVVLINNYKLSTETTVKSGVTLLIPYDSSYTTEDDEPETTETFVSNGIAYKTLTMVDGGSITVNGDICVGGLQLGSGSYDDGSNGGAGSVSGNYGCIDMSAGGTITLKSGANLYAWGYIVGQSMDEGDNTTAGTIVAESGSNVYEDFAVGDWHGGTYSMAMYNSRETYHVFPINIYHIPNIEVPLTIKYGATEYVRIYITANFSTMEAQQNVSFIGSSSSFFTMSNGSVTKRYDPQTDRTHIDIDGDLSVDGLSIKIGSTSLSSEDFVTPITHNLYVKANSGTLTIPNDMAILPHAVVEIGENATADINANVYVYDLDEWYMYASYNCYYRTYNYRPTKHLTRTTTEWKTTDALEDAKLIIDGTVNVSDTLFTTSSGADICSTKAGTINFTTAPRDSTYTYQKLQPYIQELNRETEYYQTYQYLTTTLYQYFDRISAYAPWLRNVDDSYTKSAGSAAGTTYNYVDGYWISATESLTAYTPDVETGTSTSLSEWQTLQESNPNAIAVYEGTNESVKNLTNVVVYDDENNAVCANFVATDKSPINIPFAFTATTASYSRSATSYSGDLQWGTICLPFAVAYDANSDITFYTLSSIDGNTMTFTESTEGLAANTPAIFSVTTDADRTTVDFIVEDATIPVTTEENSVTSDDLTLNAVMTATKTLTTEDDSNCYYIAQNKFWRPTTNNVTVYPFRAYFTSNGTTEAKMFSIAIGDSGETTSVSSALNSVEDEIEGVYDVSGMRRNTIQKGINIIRYADGRTRKVIIK